MFYILARLFCFFTNLLLRCVSSRSCLSCYTRCQTKSRPVPSHCRNSSRYRTSLRYTQLLFYFNLQLGSRVLVDLQSCIEYSTNKYQYLTLSVFLSYCSFAYNFKQKLYSWDLHKHFTVDVSLNEEVLVKFRTASTSGVRIRTPDTDYGSGQESP